MDNYSIFSPCDIHRSPRKFSTEKTNFIKRLFAHTDCLKPFYLYDDSKISHQNVAQKRDKKELPFKTETFASVDDDRKTSLPSKNSIWLANSTRWRQILRCYYTLDPWNKGYIDIDEACDWLDKEKNSNPDLAEFLLRILQDLIDFISSRGVLEKDVFLKVIRQWVNEDYSGCSVYSILRTPHNPVNTAWRKNDEGVNQLNRNIFSQCPFNEKLKNMIITNYVSNQYVDKRTVTPKEALSKLEKWRIRRLQKAQDRKEEKLAILREEVEKESISNSFTVAVLHKGDPAPKALPFEKTLRKCSFMANLEEGSTPKQYLRRKPIAKRIPQATLKCPYISYERPRTARVPLREGVFRKPNLVDFHTLGGDGSKRERDLNQQLSLSFNRNVSNLATVDSYPIGCHPQSDQEDPLLLPWEAPKKTRSTKLREVHDASLTYVSNRSRGEIEWMRSLRQQYLPQTIVCGIENLQPMRRSLCTSIVPHQQSHNYLNSKTKT
ncbi:hypothetical protein IE077_004107 [Cardiosporidium cionae]|uniref:EF-hand domain-containing protein n=1 Tax=Cardiosporidium cionae TaxID=476202 RepID=A0ABQ7J6R9_9APIC|nr:hypothetical protein IE077_004107 [Cardiosporidium cionae]|eukprot:KAF8819688.1 hypothetical protein IE077_004107 [Cardiosporidium cionae]